MKYKINKTESYHINEMESLGWELTVCNTLESGDSPARGILREDLTFGEHLYRLLDKNIPLDQVEKVLEVGGGYGFIMRDFLRIKQGIEASMVDISPYLLDKQRETLGDGLNDKLSGVDFICSDFFDLEREFLSRYDLALFNENIGDFPTVCDISPLIFTDDEENLDDLQLEIRAFFRNYELGTVDKEFNFNIGAVRALERLCSSGIRFIYLSEHSCEAQLPDTLKGIADVSAPGNPERIALKGHDEYTIKFSHLEGIGKKSGYDIIRGCFADFISFDYTNRINFIMRSNSQRDEHEIIRQFIEDLYKYEYVLLIKK